MLRVIVARCARPSGRSIGIRTLVVLFALLLFVSADPAEAQSDRNAPSARTTGRMTTKESPAGVSQANSAWICYTYADRPTRYYDDIVGRMTMDCNVGVTNVWFYTGIQVSGDGVNWSDQGGTFGWRFATSGPTTYAAASPTWHCIGTNPWFYRTIGYSEKTFPGGVVSYSPWKFSPSFGPNYC